MMRGKQGEGLTLIELLVVVAIITALMGLLFPVFQYVRKGAYMTVCRSNLRQIYQALKLYEEDYGEFFYKPPDRPNLIPISDTSSYPIECDLPGALYPYTKDTGIFVCPAFPANPERTCPRYRPDLPPMTYLYNYAFARFKGHPITSNLVCHLCTFHGEWRKEVIGDTIWIFRSPQLVCLMDGSIHLRHGPLPGRHFTLDPF